MLIALLQEKSKRSKLNRDSILNFEIDGLDRNNLLSLVNVRTINFGNKKTHANPGLWRNASWELE